MGPRAEGAILQPRSGSFRVRTVSENDCKRPIFGRFWQKVPQMPQNELARFLITIPRMNMNMRCPSSTTNPNPTTSPATTGRSSASAVSSGDAGLPASTAPREGSALAPANKTLLETLREGFAESGETLMNGVGKLAEGHIIDGFRDVVTGLLQGAIQVVSALSTFAGYLKMPALDLLKGRT
jgi:hypothetical protein